MLTNLVIRNFKRFDHVEIELGDPVLFIGPNNWGKTSAMQALALWNAGLKRWNARRGGSTGPEKRPGVTVNRRDLVAVPTPAANLLRAVVILDEPAADGSDDPFEFLSWNRREIENYLCSRATLASYAAATAETHIRSVHPGPIFVGPEIERRTAAMTEVIGEVEAAMTTLGRGSPWGGDTKVSDDFLTPLFEAYYKRLDLPNLMRKTNFHVLADHVPDDEIDPEIIEKLDAIARTEAAAVRP